MRLGWRLLALILLAMPVAVDADPGVEVARGNAEGVAWYLYAESPGLVLGEGSLGVLLEDPEAGVLLEPKLQMTIAAPDGSKQTRIAQPGFADNLLIQGAPVFFHETGTWTLETRSPAFGGGEMFRISFEVHDGPGLWRRAWPWLLFPLVVLLVARATRPRGGRSHGSSRRSPAP